MYCQEPRIAEGGVRGSKTERKTKCGFVMNDKNKSRTEIMRDIDTLASNAKHWHDAGVTNTKQVTERLDRIVVLTKLYKARTKAGDKT